MDLSFFGYKAGKFNTVGIENTFIGSEAGRGSYKRGTGGQNTFIGDKSGQGNSTGSKNTYVGALSGRGGGAGAVTHDAGSSSSNNTSIGYAAGYYNISGNNNTFLGYEAGYRNTAKNDNVYIGLSAGRNNQGEGNVFIGMGSGFHLGLYLGLSQLGIPFFTPSGNNNTIIGKGANIVGSQNIIIGHNAGPPLYTVPLANFTLQHHSRLFIDIEQSNTPLIYGEFNNDLIRINGEFEVMGGMSQSSDIHAKEEIIEIDYNSILEKVAQLEISEWQYIDYNDRRHIGPMAQDFHAAFGFGDDDTTISSLDVDGVALAAIKALKNKTDQLEKKNAVLVARLARIEKRLNISN